MNTSQLLGWLAWALGCYMTYDLAASLTPGSAAWWIPVAGAVFAQLSLTKLQRPIWTSGRAPWWCWVALFLDALINAMNSYRVIGRLPDTPLWEYLQYAISATITLNAISISFIALLAGVMIAALPEWLWSGATTGGKQHAESTA